MRQYFYLVAHTIVGDDLTVDKIFLQEHDAVRWGRTLATKNPDYSVGLYRQEISRTAVLGYVKGLTPFKPQKGADSDIDHNIEGNRIPEETIVRENLMTREGYSPYCLNCSVMPRTFFNGTQFQCPHCGWISQFPEDFIERYKKKWKLK